MSGIVAWLRLDGGPARDDTFLRLVRISAYHGPDHTGTWSAGTVALAHHQLCTTPESEHERQPTPSHDSGLCVTFDGRLDNRGELLAAFSLRPAEQVTDVELLLRAYERWGIDCVDHLLGDYGFALWDAREQRLFCARDPLGVRPLYYALYAGQLAVTSGLRELVASGCMPREINEGMVGEYLTGNLRSVAETLYRHAYRLPAGHRMVADARGVRVSRYWKPENVAELGVTRRDAAEEFRALLVDAVRCRARSQRPIAAHLSGGLDSSSVVSILGSLQRRGELSQPFETFTLTFPGLSCDETEYAEAVAKRYDLSWHRLAVGKLPAVDYEPLAVRFLDFPGYPNGTFAAPLLERIHASGTRVVLTGTGGDDWLGSASPVARTLDLLPRGHWLTLKRELEGFAWHAVAGAAARHLAARTLDRCGLRGPRNGRIQQRIPRWIAPSLVRRSGLVERMSALPPVPRGWSWSRASRLNGAHAGIRVHPLETEHRTDRDRQLEMRHPFYDVRVVEFLLALPEPFCATQSMNKLVLREAMRGVLPEAVRHRQSKAVFTHVYFESLGSDAVRGAFARMGSDSSPDWIDGPKARTALEASLGQRSTRHLWSLWCAYGIDLWWRVLDTKPFMGDPRGVAASPAHGSLPEEAWGISSKSMSATSPTTTG